MSRPSPSSPPPRRRPQKRHLGPEGLSGWEAAAAAAAADDEGWAGPPRPVRSRWQEPEAEGRADEMAGAAGPGEPLAFEAWGGQQQQRRRRRRHHRPAAQRLWGSPPRDAAWERSEGDLRPPWGAGLGGGRRGSPLETFGDDRRSPSPGQRSWGSPEAPRRQLQGPRGETSGWESPESEGSWGHSRDAVRPAWAKRQGSPGGAAGRWGTAGGRRKESPSPGRDLSWGSPERDLGWDHQRRARGWSQSSRDQAVDSPNGSGGRWGRTERRGREHPSPTRQQSNWSSPKREGRQESLGSIRYDVDLREQHQLNLDEAGGSQSSAWYREEYYQNLNRGAGRSGQPFQDQAHSSQVGLQREWQSPNGDARRRGSPMRYDEGENVDETGANEYSPERGGKKGTYDTGSGSPWRITSPTHLISDSPAVPKAWTPHESVVHWWLECRRSNLRAKMRKQLMSIWPRPTLPDRSSETPQINPSIMSFLQKKEQWKVRTSTQLTFRIQSEVLDMLAPTMTICEMAEEAIEKEELVDPRELREWSRHLICFIANINHLLTLQCRRQVLGAINMRLMSLASKMKGPIIDGMLFTEDKEKLLKEIIMRFPELSEAERRTPWKTFRTFNPAANYKPPRKRTPWRPHSKPLGTGLESSADLSVEQSHDPGTEGQGPAN